MAEVQGFVGKMVRVVGVDKKNRAKITFSLLDGSSTGPLAIDLSKDVMAGGSLELRPNAIGPLFFARKYVLDKKLKVFPLDYKVPRSQPAGNKGQEYFAVAVEVTRVTESPHGFDGKPHFSIKFKPVAPGAKKKEYQVDLISTLVHPHRNDGGETHVLPIKGSRGIIALSNEYLNNKPDLMKLATLVKREKMKKS